MENEFVSKENLRTICWYGDVCTNECKSDCIRYLEMKFLMDNSNLPKAKQKPIDLYPDDIDYDTFVELAKIKDNIVDFVANGNNMYIASETTGNGKTSWAIKLMLKYFNEIWSGNGFKPRALFIYVPSFLTQLKNFDKKDQALEEIKILLPKVDLVVWDDIASVGISNYDLSQLLTYLDVRVLDEKYNIYTGNLLGKDLEDVLGTRLFSRVWNGSKKFFLKGKDQRGLE